MTTFAGPDQPSRGASGTARIRVEVPGHLRTLAGITGEVAVDAAVSESGVVTIGAILDAVEWRFPMLRGAMRDHDGGPRRPYIRFFACERDLSFDPYDAAAPARVSDGTEPFLVVGSVAGG